MLKHDQYVEAWKIGKAPQRVLECFDDNLSHPPQYTFLRRLMELRGTEIWYTGDQSGEHKCQIKYQTTDHANRGMDQHKAQLLKAGIGVTDYEVAFGHCFPKREKD